MSRTRFLNAEAGAEVRPQGTTLLLKVGKLENERLMNLRASIVHS
jgi:hypothetical protein